MALVEEVLEVELRDDFSEAEPLAGAFVLEGDFARAEVVDRDGDLLRVELVDFAGDFDRVELVDFAGDFARAEVVDLVVDLALVEELFAGALALDVLFFVVLFAVLFLDFTAIDLAPFIARQVVHAQPARRDGSVLE